jgi:hypothetical protein
VAIKAARFAMLVVRSRNSIAAMHKTNYTDLITGSRIIFRGATCCNAMHSGLRPRNALREPWLRSTPMHSQFSRKPFRSLEAWPSV